MTWALMVDRGKRKGAVIPIRKFPFAMGRDDDCQLRAANPYVSHHHCELQSDGDRMIIRDCNSTNGTFINSLRIAEEEVELHEGDRIKIGSLTFLVCLENSDSRPPAQEVSGPPEPAQEPPAQESPVRESPMLEAPDQEAPAQEAIGGEQEPKPAKGQKLDEDSVGDMLLDLEESQPGPPAGSWRNSGSPDGGSEKEFNQPSGPRTAKNMRPQSSTAQAVASKMLKGTDVSRLKPK
jgi:pSer/pThr/pTyr-binding forkhead associated (FHA) protein